MSIEHNSNDNNIIMSCLRDDEIYKIILISYEFDNNKNSIKLVNE